MKRIIVLSSGILMTMVLVIAAFTSRSLVDKEKICQSAPRGMVFIESDSLLPYYISAENETNLHWQIYMEWLQAVYAHDTYLYRDAMPVDADKNLTHPFNQPVYFVHSGHWDYPVTGVSWRQVKDYLEWKTDRLNEMILQETEINMINTGKMSSQNFSTEAYLHDQFYSTLGKNYKEAFSGERIAGYREVRTAKNNFPSKGILFPAYRLPTEKELEVASVYLQDPMNNGIIKDAFRKRNFLGFWQDYLRVREDGPSKMHGPAYKVSEWLLDDETYSWMPWQNNYETMLANGWRPFLASSPYDNYGNIRETDKYGKLPFSFVQLSSVNIPIYLAKPYQDSSFRFRDTTVTVPYKCEHSENGIAFLMRSVYVNGYFYSNNELIYLLNHFATEHDTASRQITYSYRVPVESVQIKKRKVVSVNKNGRSTLLKKETESVIGLGFRCLLPYTGVPVSKKYRVKWDQ